MTTAKLRKTAAGVVENRVGMVHFRVNTWQNGSYGRFSHLRFRLSAAPGRGLAAVVARWLGVACPAGAGGCAPLRPLKALRAAWFLWQFAPRGTGAVARGASGWHTGGCGRLPFGIAKQAVLHGETGRSGRPRGTFGSAIRRKLTMPKFTSHFSYSFTAIVYILEHPLLNDFTALEKCP